MTELDVAKGIQTAIGDLDLNHPHARTACLGLISSLERSLDRIKAAEDEAEEAEYDRQISVVIAPTYPLCTISDALRMVKPA